MDPTVPSSKKFLRQLPGYKPTVKEQKIDDQIYGMGGSTEAKFDACKNELCQQEQVILNMISFDLDSYPLFVDIVEIFMAQGVLYTTDK